MKSPRYMPQGRCSGCGDETSLPPAFEGLCFLCATDGIPGANEPTFGALAEDEVRADPTANWYEPDERQRDILDLFVEQQQRFAQAVGFDAHRTQKHATWTRTRTRREPEESINEYLEKRAKRRQRQRVREECSARVEERRAAKRVEEAERVARDVEAFQRHLDSVLKALTPIPGPDGARGPVRGPNSKVRSQLVRIQDLRERGLSLREIVAETGLSKATVQKYAPQVSQSAAMVRKHVRWKEAGTPVVPPWKRGAD